MPRKALDQEMQKLHAQIMQTGSLVEETLAKALASLETGDQAELRLLITTGSDVNRLNAAIEKQALHLLILQQPLGGRDLRYLTAAIPIAGKLEQAGDEAMEIAQLILEMPPLNVNAIIPVMKAEIEEVHDGSTIEPIQITEKVILRALLDLGREALYMLQEAMRAFDRNNSKAARDVEAEWEFVELRYQRVVQDLMTVLASTYTTVSAVQSGLYLLQNAIHLFWLAQQMKQFADHAKKICKRVIYIVEG
jgi:phosphate transport system protein